MPSAKEIARRTEAAALLMAIAESTDTLRERRAPGVSISMLAWEQDGCCGAGLSFITAQIQRLAEAQGLTTLKRPAKELRRLMRLAVEATAIEWRFDPDGRGPTPSGNDPNPVYRWWFLGRLCINAARTLDPSLSEES